MNKIKYFILTILVAFNLLVSTSSTADQLSKAEASKVFYYMGAGGEPSGEKTIFDNRIKLVGKLVNNSKWDTTISINGNHENTERIIKDDFKKAKNLGSFTKENYYKMIEEMTAKITSGDLVKGSQILITIDTHGAKNNKEKTHQISTTGSSIKNYETLEGADIVNLDPLENLAEIAVKNGVRLAIIDLSCFSGNLLNIKNDNICMISATSPDHYAYTSTGDGFFGIRANAFGDKLVASFKKGKNLEELFLAALESTTVQAPDFPMISSPEGQSIHSLLYENLIPFLNANKSQFSEMLPGFTGLDTPFKSMYSNLDSLDTISCSLSQKKDALINFIERIENITKNTTDFRSLKLALDQYRDYQKKYENLLWKSKDINDEYKKILLNDYPQEYERLHDIGTSFLTGNQDELLNTLFPDREELDDATKKMLKKIEKDITIRKEIVARLSPEKVMTLMELKNIESDLNTTNQLAGKVGLEVKKLFLKLYAQKHKDTSNPCRDFIL